MIERWPTILEATRSWCRLLTLLSLMPQPEAEGGWCAVQDARNAASGHFPLTSSMLPGFSAE
jgi:hypothetical protein